MAKMSIFQLGVIIFAICISTQQVLSQNDTSPADNSTSPINSTMVTPTSANFTNSTTAPTGRGVSLHAGTFSSLMPFIAVGIALIQRFC